MQNIIFAWPNRTEAATLSGGAWSTNSPLNNLKTRYSFEVARSADTALASTQLQCALDKVRSVRCMALLRHNLTVAGSYRLCASNTAGDFSAPIADTGWVDAWPSMKPFGDTDWGDEGWWGGKPAAEDIAGYPSILLVVLPAAVRARYWRLELDDTGNPAGYVEAGRLWIGGQWQPEYNMSLGMGLRWEDASKSEKSVGGTFYPDEREKTRVLTASLDSLSHDEAHARYLEMTRQLGTTRELLVVPDADDAMHMIRRSFVGCLRQLSPAEAYSKRRYKGAIEIKETV